MRLVLSLLITLMVVVVGEASAQHERRDAKAIALVKSLDVSRLDKTQRGKTFSKWLAGLLGGTPKVEWEVNDCGEQDGSGRQRDFPICVQAEAQTADNVGVAVLIVVGTHRRGITGEPQVWGIWVKSKDRDPEVLDELSELVLKLRTLQGFGEEGVT